MTDTDIVTTPVPPIDVRMQGGISTRSDSADWGAWSTISIPAGASPISFAQRLLPLDRYRHKAQLVVFNGLSGVTNPVPSQPAVPATGVAQQNVNSYPVQVVISPNGATITNVSVNGITVGTAAGTYVVPAFGSISIAYSVATPTWVWSNASSTVGVNPGAFVLVGKKEQVMNNQGAQLQAGRYPIENCQEIWITGDGTNAMVAIVLIERWSSPSDT